MSSNLITFTSTGKAICGSSATVQAEVGTMCLKIRVKGDFFAKATGNNDDWNLCSISNGTYAGRKVYVTLHRGADAAHLNIRAWWNSASTAQGNSAIFDIATVDQAAFYIIYCEYVDANATPAKTIIYNADGSVFAADASATNTGGALNTTAGNGQLVVGTGGNFNGAAMTVDGCAVYSGIALTGGNQWSAPAPGDTGLALGVTFDEGSGTSAANLKSGEGAFTLTGNTWTAGGTWDSASITATTIAKQSGDFQAAQVGTALASPLRVLVTGAGSAPVPGYSVTFVIVSGGGSFGGTATVTTDASGIATAPGWTMGASPGTNTVTVTDGALAGSPLTFTAFGTSGPTGSGGRRLINGSLIQPAGRS